jgi:hypothetical protein
MAFTSNAFNNNLSKKEKIAALKQRHQSLFEKLGVVNPIFLPKTMFGTPKVFYLFPSELRHERDIYTEMVDKEYNSEDSERILYRWKFQADYKTRYAQKEFKGSGDHLSVIPFDELERIEAEDEADEFGIPNPDEDAPISELTIRDLTAILTGKPVSHKAWLNKIMKS